ncbi:MAG TPA: hypothetical protein VFS88_07005 [Micavibrio sp.]|nr:hypothetical protein [Micavibrio sp.]
MLSFREAKILDKPTTLAAYFQETVFLTATDANAKSSFFRKVWGTNYKKAEDTARLFMANGLRLSARMDDRDYSFEDAIVALVDHQRKKLGLPVSKMVYYKKGDVNRLWPGLHIAGLNS